MVLTMIIGAACFLMAFLLLAIVIALGVKLIRDKNRSESKDQYIKYMRPSF